MSESDLEKIERGIDDLNHRVSRLELSDAVVTVRYESIKQRLDKIDGHISKLVWLMVLAIGSAFMSFIMSGGLNGIQ